MKLTVKTKNIALTDALKNFAEKKFFALRKFISILKKEEEKKTLADVLVELEKETKHHKKGDVFVAKCIIRLPGRSLMSAAKSDDMSRSIIEAKNEMEREIKKYKFKKTDIRRREQRKLKRQNII